MRRSSLDTCVIFLTRDRPVTALSNLRQLARCDTFKIVLDNSRRSNFGKSIRSLSRFSDVLYNGPRQQSVVMNAFARFGSSVPTFTAPLGATYWNTGFVRNYALLLSEVIGFQKVLFVDDDVSVKDPKLLQAAFRILEHVDFVGARIGGLADQSIIGHIGLRQSDPELSEFVSGGFMGLRLGSVMEPFLNYYNEDWIWVLMHREASYAMTPAKVVHQTYHSLLRNGSNRAIRQEMGEMLLEGVWNAAPSRNFSLLTNEKAWIQVIADRVLWIEDIAKKCRQQQDRIGIAIATALLRHVSTISPSLLTAIFEQYFAVLPEWRRILKAASRLAIPQKMKQSIGLETTFD